MRVFVSSTSKDLKPYRSAAAEMIRAAQWQPVMMEDFPADPRPIVRMCREVVSSCDRVILLQAHRRGWAPPPDKGGDGNTSITAFEIEAADEASIPVMAFLADGTWPGELWDEDQAARAWTRNFRNGLNRNAKFFRAENDPQLPAFRALIAQEIANARALIANPAVRPAPAVLSFRARALDPVALPAEPYPLLGPYAHPETFAGREAEIEKLFTLAQLPQLVLCVHAASGAGKSSLLQAGLAPRLRDAGHAVSVERSPWDAGLAQRLIRDLLEPADSILLADDDGSLPRRFAEWIARTHEVTRKSAVIVLDQIDDVLRNAATADRVLSRIGPLMSATAQRLPGSQGFACKWVICYRHEYHGAVRRWLVDVLAPARRQGRAELDDLPHDLSEMQKSHEWALPVMGASAAGEDGTAQCTRAFRAAIERPLGQLCDDGSPRYRYRISREDAERLAAVFARARQAQPEAALVPELQIMLNHLLVAAASRAPAGAPVGVQVPPDDALDSELRHALTRHLERALDAVPGRDDLDARSARTRALLALNQLADAEGRRGPALDRKSLAHMIGPNGDEVIGRLSAADTRLVIDTGGRCALSHDCVADAVTRMAAAHGAGRSGLLDHRLIDLQRLIDRRVALHVSDPQDTASLGLTRGQRALIDGNREVFLFDAAREAWWTKSEGFHHRRLRRWGAITAVLLMAATTAFLLIVRAQEREQTTFQQAFRPRLESALQKLDFSELSKLALDYPAEWAELPGAQDIARLTIDGSALLFTTEPFKSTPIRSTDLLNVIDRGHRLFLESRTLFGAMSYALEEVASRPESMPGERDRARALYDQVRAAFIARLEKESHERPSPREQGGQTWVSLPAGSFVMGATEGSDAEQPPHEVRLSSFSIQRYEVTNEEYKRFNRDHQFPPERAKHPVATVSWYEAAAYAAWLGGSLPTEAQWEYAARGLNGRTFPWGFDASALETRAVFGPGGTMPVGSKPNGRTPDGLEDMAGNAMEWCRDWYAEDWYKTAARGDVATDPLGPTTGERRVVRSGQLGSLSLLRATSRGSFPPTYTDNDPNLPVGIRVVSSRLAP